MIESVIRPVELDAWEAWWLKGGDHPSASHVLDGDVDGAEQALWVAICADREQWWYGAWCPGMDWRDFLTTFGDRLSEWVSETSFGWGEWRQAVIPRD